MLSLSNAKLIQNFRTIADFVGRVDVGGTTSITVSALMNEDINVNDTLCVLSGANNGKDILISGFDEGEMALAGNTLAISVRDTIAILSISFDSYILQAEKSIESDLRNKGALLENFLTKSQLEQMHIYKTLSLICGDRRMGSDLTDSYNSNFERFNQMYQMEFNSLMADYDVDEDGEIDTNEQLVFKGQVGFVR